MEHNALILVMILAGSALMVFNIFRYCAFERFIRKTRGWEKENRILYIPIVLLVLFLAGYIVVGLGLFGEPNIVMAGILLGGSIFVFIILNVMRRITEKIIEQEQLKTALRDAERASEAKTIFLSNMSHDIRTPLNAIIGYTKLAESGETGEEELRDYMGKISASGQHLLVLINDVLEMSRIESGKIEPEEESCDIEKLVKEGCDMFALQMKEKNINFSVETDVETHGVRCDKGMFDRVVMNLVSNAYKYTPEGGSVKVTLRQTGSGPEGGLYELRVKDTGIGMTEEFAEKIFDMFERERTSTVSGIQGAGLGMAITKSIIDMMGGTIEVDTEPGKGSEFIVRVAFCECDDAKCMAARERARARTEEGQTDLTGRRVLLVDDMQINREVAKMMLENDGMIVETADNGKMAVQMVNDADPGHYDVVLMDIQMPEMDGYEATSQIRSLDDSAVANLPIIAVTANAFKEDLKKAEEADMNGHIAKPIDPAKLRKTLSEILR